MTPSDFPWRPGMLGLSDDTARAPLRVLSVEPDGSLWVARQGGDVYLRSLFWWAMNYNIPNLTDGPTKGALLEAVREAFTEPTLAVFPVVGGFIITRLVDDANGRWSHDTLTTDGEWIGDATDDDRLPIRTPTEGAALLAAWEARPQ